VSAATPGTATHVDVILDVAEFIIGRAFARPDGHPGGKKGLREIVLGLKYLD
jgi:hypothetical protein